MSIVVIIVNYRTADLTSDAVRSVLADDANAHVIVVDNASGDDSELLLRQRWTNPRVQIIGSPHNLGFGGGINFAAAQSPDGDLFILNSDAFVKPGCLRHLKRSFEDDPRLGIVAPTVLMPDGALQTGAHGMFPSLRTMVTRSNSRMVETDEPDWVSGVAMLLRRSAFEEIGGFDRGYKLYFEDIDLCHRIRNAGWRVRIAHDAAVVHLGGASQPSTKRQLQEYAASQERYLRAHGYPKPVAGAIRLLRRPFDLLRSRRTRAGRGRHTSNRPQRP